MENWKLVFQVITTIALIGTFGTFIIFLIGKDEHMMAVSLVCIGTFLILIGGGLLAGWIE